MHTLIECRCLPVQLEGEAEAHLLARAQIILAIFGVNCHGNCKVAASWPDGLQAAWCAGKSCQPLSSQGGIALLG